MNSGAYIGIIIGILVFIVLKTGRKPLILTTLNPDHWLHAYVSWQMDELVILIT